MTVTKPMEDYLEAIYRTSAADGRVSTGEIARAMGVSSASATYMFKKLAAEGLVEYEGYTGVSLTLRGRRVALRVVRIHRLIERFLVDLLNIPWDRVHTLAHEMEHTLPEEVVDRFDQVLGYPTTCPHGHPIPTKDGQVVSAPVKWLKDCEQGDSGLIAAIADNTPELLRYLDRLSLRPGNRVEIVDKNPLDKTMVVRTEMDEAMIGERIVDCIALVDPAADDSV